jgi:hypothetical protein
MVAIMQKEVDIRYVSQVKSERLLYVFPVQLKQRPAVFFVLIQEVAHILTQIEAVQFTQTIPVKGIQYEE